MEGVMHACVYARMVKRRKAMTSRRGDVVTHKPKITYRKLVLKSMGSPAGSLSSSSSKFPPALPKLAGKRARATSHVRKKKGTKAKKKKKKKTGRKRRKTPTWLTLH